MNRAEHFSHFFIMVVMQLYYEDIYNYSDHLKIQLTEMKGNRILRSINFALGHKSQVLEVQEIKSDLEEKFLWH